MKIFIPKEGMLPDSYFPEKKTLIFQKKKTANVFLLKFFSLDFCVCAGRVGAEITAKTEV
jgi:hypothetical protein